MASMIFGEVFEIIIHHIFIKSNSKQFIKVCGAFVIYSIYS
ncbi:hypothetical protein RF007C_11525 [Ruminococcus flavefaciens 007c]|uniref:Uncharacterized protein n=1 Tax=Ruminococcus flavefaciens 007c TaxID=1341157 RepID=W7UKC8_RUMFL|nr:hypothetical protein RF007C_11525 [Ruminococcus flavefaciens 007c]